MVREGGRGHRADQAGDAPQPADVPGEPETARALPEREGPRAVSGWHAQDGDEMSTTLKLADDLFLVPGEPLYDHDRDTTRQPAQVCVPSTLRRTLARRSGRPARASGGSMTREILRWSARRAV